MWMLITGYSCFIACRTIILEENSLQFEIPEVRRHKSLIEHSEFLLAYTALRALANKWTVEAVVGVFVLNSFKVIVTGRLLRTHCSCLEHAGSAYGYLTAGEDCREAG